MPKELEGAQIVRGRDVYVGARHGNEHRRVRKCTNAGRVWSGNSTLEDALARAIERASRAARSNVVAQLARRLEARRSPRSRARAGARRAKRRRREWRVASPSPKNPAGFSRAPGSNGRDHVHAKSKVARHGPPKARSDAKVTRYWGGTLRSGVREGRGGDRGREVRGDSGRIARRSLAPRSVGANGLADARGKAKRGAVRALGSESTNLRATRSCGPSATRRPMRKV